ncbi:MAG TPA: hypothetical protein VJM31_13935 [Vicinamibacterales bacterium]|nr:hypothetical protein [Vicinamibacterales bacterium]
MPVVRAFVRFVVELTLTTVALTIAPFYSIQSKAALIDPDIWWHIRLGDWIASHRGVPSVGVLSQHFERPWVAYSWGFDLLVSAVHRFYGLPGIVGFLICFQVLISLVFLVAIRHLAGNPWWSWLIGALSIYAFYINPLRPGLFTLLFFTLELLVIFDAERRADDRRLLWMGPLFMLWANFHIQFVYGLFVFGLYVAARLAAGYRETSASATGPRALLLGSLVLAAACSCIGPNGVTLYKVAFNFAAHPAIYQVIQELSAMNFRRPEHYVQLLLLMAACFAAGRSRRIDLFLPLLLVVTAFVSFRSLRDSWFVSIAAGFVLAESARGGARKSGINPAGAQPLVRPAIQYALAAVLAIGASFVMVTRQGITMPALAAVIDRVYPLRATDFIRESGLKGPMYNDFNWGGFLIYRLPNHPVSMDSRTDLYGDELLAQSRRTNNATPGWQQDPHVTRANFILIQNWYPLAAALANDRQFRLVYRDHIAVIFVREPPG